MNQEREYRITSVVLAVILIISSLMQMGSCSIRRESEKERIESNQHIVDSLNNEIDSLQHIIIESTNE